MSSKISIILLVVLALLSPVLRWTSAEKKTTYGKVIFIEIPQLPQNWWKNPNSAWDVWNRDTYYLWGANKNNYLKFDKDISLKGSGMASENGPTRGRGHPHYIGIITTSLRDEENEKIFSQLEDKLKSGSDIVFPVIKGRFSLGTGVAFKRHATLKDWYRSQLWLFKKMVSLGSISKEVQILSGTFWPDCGLTMDSESTFNMPISSIEDMQKIVDYLEAKIQGTGKR